MEFPFPIPPEWHICRAQVSRRRVTAAWVVAGALGVFAVAWSAFGAEVAKTKPGETQQHNMLCVNQKSAALFGQTVDDEKDILPDVMQTLLRKRLCAIFPDELAPAVTMKAKVQHVAATDVWEVKWGDETWFVAIDAPREPDL